MAKIVMIEDSKILGNALKGALEIKGHEVVWVNDGGLLCLPSKRTSRT